jgi:hypothetical protein
VLGGLLLLARSRRRSAAIVAEPAVVVPDLPEVAEVVS